MSDLLNIALAQQNFLVGDVESNTKKIIQCAEQARDEYSADIIVFSELAITGYPLEDLLFRPLIIQRVEQALESIKLKVQDIYVLVGAPIKENESLFNAALLIYNNNIVAKYYKQKLPNYDVFDEKRYFRAGQAACAVDIKNVQVGFTICEDIWFPEPIKASVDAGAELIININASPYEIGKTEKRIEVLESRVEEQGVPIIYVNQVGGQDELVFDGESFCINKTKDISLRAPAFKEGIFTVQYSLVQHNLVSSACVSDALDHHDSVYQALLLGVKDYVVKNKFQGVVLGLSGGVDSALTLAIAVDALGANRVHALMMPFRYTSEMSIEDAREMASNLGVKFDEITIEEAYEAITHSLSPIFEDYATDVTEENIQSRIRGLFLMAVSNKTGRMLLTTGNKSEMSVGYATLYGDMAGGFAPLKDVSKTLVFELAHYRNKLGCIIPPRIITRPPSAELAPDQVDEDSLPPYEILDPILELFVEQDVPIDEIVVQGYEREVVQRVAKLVLRNEYKRRQTPPGVKITSRAFGKDRRYPITSGYL